MADSYDAIVLGLGAMGSASLYQLAKRNLRVLGIDRFSPPHSFGSSHGDTRIIRKATGEGEQYVPLALRSYEIWRDIERETGEELLEITGGLIISNPDDTTLSHGQPAIFDTTIRLAEKYAIQHDVLSSADIRRRFPQFNVSDAERGYYEYDMGYLRPEKSITANLQLAQRCGAQIHTAETVQSFTQEESRVIVHTDRGEYRADRLVVSAGPWLPTLLDDKYDHLFQIHRQVMYWFAPKTPIERFSAPAFPVWVWELAEGQAMYGFPAVDGPQGGVKLASEEFEAATDQDPLERAVSPEETERMYTRYVAPHFPDLSEKSVKAVACSYTVTPDYGFVIDNHPGRNRILIVSPCSGHGFKHSAAIGESVAQLLAEEKSAINLSAFSFKRFA